MRKLKSAVQIVYAVILVIYWLAFISWRDVSDETAKGND